MATDTCKPRLHIAMQQGPAKSQEILNLLESSEGPDLAKELDDETGCSALHEFFSTLLSESFLKATRSYGWDPSPKLKPKILDKIFSHLVLHNPEAIKTKDKKGNLPIHYAVNTGDPSYAIDLVNKFPKSLQIKGSDQQLPIHKACNSNVPLGDRAIRFLVERCPEALPERDAAGMLPIHLAVKNRNCYPSSIQCLVDNYVNGVKERDGKEMLPIHWAAFNGCSRVDTIKILVEKYPSCLKKHNKDGMIPIHLALGGRHDDVVQSIDDKTYVDSMSEFYSKIFYMLEKCPSSAKEQTPNGNLPIHFAAFRASEPIIRRLIEMHPKGLQHKNSKSELPIECCGKCIDSFALLARGYPDSLHDCSNYPLFPLFRNLRMYNVGKHRADAIEGVLKLYRDHALPNAQSKEYKKVLEEKKQLLAQMKTQENQYQAVPNPQNEEYKRVLEEKELLLVQMKNLERKLEMSRSLEMESLEQYKKTLKEKEEQFQDEKKKRKKNEKEVLDMKKQLDRSRSCQGQWKREVAEGREIEKLYLSSIMLDPTSDVPTTELMAFGTLLVTKINRLQAKVAPGVDEPTIAQAMFEVIESHQNPPRMSLLKCIKALHAEKTRLEGQIENEKETSERTSTESTPETGAVPPVTNGAVGFELMSPSSASAAKASPDRHAKRPRVSL